MYQILIVIRLKTAEFVHRKGLQTIVGTSASRGDSGVCNINGIAQGMLGFYSLGVLCGRLQNDK